MLIQPTRLSGSVIAARAVPHHWWTSPWKTSSIVEDLLIVRREQLWVLDISHVRLAREFVYLAASNIPLGTVLELEVTSKHGAKKRFQSTPLTGTEDSSTASARVDLSGTFSQCPPGGGHLLGLSGVQPLPAFVEGERVTRIRVASLPGRESAVFLVTERGSTVRLR